MKVKILVVDDNKSVCSIYQSMLNSQGYEAETAVDGQTALDLMKKESFDLLLLDIMMPQMDGLHILDIIKSNSDFRDVKVIMLTALSDDHIKVDAEKFGACDFIVKSESDMNDVLKKIDKALSRC
ncbi:MAG: response regulator [Patescibacteria group bacterium]|jgi:CheY-like chemotaxis protein|nr:response regulator [Patescibacteria group bacterium]